jgi:hypothetical protein
MGIIRRIIDETYPSIDDVGLEPAEMLYFHMILLKIEEFQLGRTTKC